MYYVGVDLHKEQSWFYIMDKSGNRVSSKSISNDIDVLKKYFALIPKPFTLALEATYNWYFFVDLAQEYAQQVYLANSYELKAFARRNKKTDKIDARLIADVLRKGYLPVVHIPDKQTRELKEFLRYRMNLVKDRTRTIVRLKSLLNRCGIKSTPDFTTYKGLDSFDSSVLPPGYDEIARKYIEYLKWYTQEIYQCREELRDKLALDKDIINLTSIPGISFFAAALIKTEISDISRFRCFNRLCAYAGLAPRVHQSANTLRHGPLNKNRCKYLQWILIETCIHFVKAMPDTGQRYQRIKNLKGANTAKIAAARDMLKAVYHVLKEKRPFSIILCKNKKYAFISGHTRPARSVGSEVPLSAGASWV